MQARLSWWESIVSESGGQVKLPARQIKRSTDKIQLWLESQVAPSLAVFGYITINQAL